MSRKKITPAKLIEIRKSLGLNQSQFWSRLGITQSGGSRHESGRTLPKPVGMLVRIAYTAEFSDIVHQLSIRRRGEILPASGPGRASQ